MSALMVAETQEQGITKAWMYFHHPLHPQCSLLLEYTALWGGR